MALWPTPFVKSAQQRTAVIRKEVAAVRARIPDMQDKTPWWAKLLEIWAWVLLVGAVIAAGIYFGVGPIVRSALAWAGWFIPKPKQSAAKLLVEGHTTEAVAVMRETDPMLDAAYRQQKAKQKEQ